MEIISKFGGNTSTSDTKQRLTMWSTNDSPGSRTPGKCEGSDRSTSRASRRHAGSAQTPPPAATILEGRRRFLASRWRPAVLGVASSSLRHRAAGLGDFVRHEHLE